MMAALDGWQRQARWAGVPYAVLEKSSDDNANLLVVGLAWYGFTAIFPLLLVVVTVFGFLGAQSIAVRATPGWCARSVPRTSSTTRRRTSPTGARVTT
jgi:uncharacterized BrkB/YihY/UPF0761 family membrane protein